MKIKNVEEYIASERKEEQDKLKEIRKAIKEAAPEVEEKISYGMPYYHYKGRLAYFRLAKNHVGLYIPPPIIAEHKKELKKYATATSTIQFSLSEELPINLIKKLIKARMKYNEQILTRK